MVTTAPFFVPGFKRLIKRWTHNEKRTSGADFASILPPFCSQKDTLRLVRFQSQKKNNQTWVSDSHMINFSRSSATTRLVGGHVTSQRGVYQPCPLKWCVRKGTEQQRTRLEENRLWTTVSWLSWLCSSYRRYCLSWTLFAEPNRHRPVGVTPPPDTSMYNSTGFFKIKHWLFNEKFYNEAIRRR